MTKLATDTKDDAPAPETLKKVQPAFLRGDGFKEAGFLRNEWGANIPADVPYEDVLKPPFWRLVSRRMALGDEIIARDDKLRYWARLIVVSVDHISASVNVRELQKVELGDGGGGKSSLQSHLQNSSGALNFSPG